MADGIISQSVEARLRDGLALDTTAADPAPQPSLKKRPRDRLILDARLAALAVDNPESHLKELSQSLRDSGLPQGQRPAF